VLLGFELYAPKNIHGGAPDFSGRRGVEVVDAGQENQLAMIVPSNHYGGLVSRIWTVY